MLGAAGSGAQCCERRAHARVLITSIGAPVSCTGEVSEPARHCGRAAT